MGILGGCHAYGALQHMAETPSRCAPDVHKPHVHWAWQLSRPDKYIHAESMGFCEFTSWLQGSSTLLYSPLAQVCCAPFRNSRMSMPPRCSGAPIDLACILVSVGLIDEGLTCALCFSHVHPVCKPSDAALCAGMRVRHPRSLLAGMMWFDPDKSDPLGSMRHLAQERDGMSGFSAMA